jgi:hypothetical protein
MKDLPKFSPFKDQKRDFNPLKCLKHNLMPVLWFCALCDAKKKANGNTEEARRAFVNRNLQIRLYE